MSFKEATKILDNVGCEYVDIGDDNIQIYHNEHKQRCLAILQRNKITPSVIKKLLKERKIEND